MLLFDASTKFQLRILAPIFISLLILLVLFGVWLWKKRREVAIVLALFIIGISIYNQIATVQDLSKGGQGFASFDWYDSKAMAYLRTIPRTMMIYTNETGAVYLYTDRPTYSLPNRFDPVTAQVRSGYEQGVALMHQQILIRESGAGASSPAASNHRGRMPRFWFKVYIRLVNPAQALYTPPRHKRLNEDSRKV